MAQNMRSKMQSRLLSVSSLSGAPVPSVEDGGAALNRATYDLRSLCASAADTRTSRMRDVQPGG